MIIKTEMEERLKKILKHYGLKHQTEKTREEFNELLVELDNYDGSVKAKNRVKEELADVMNMVLQVKEGVGITSKDLAATMHYKINRQLGRIEVEKLEQKKKEMVESHDIVDFGDWLEVENEDE